MAEAIWVVVIGTGAAAYVLSAIAKPTGDVAGSVAQIGATLLVAYAVQTGWVVNASRERGSERENWVGIMTGLGFCALVGIGFGLSLSGHDGSFGLPERIGFAWSVVSVGMLGIWVALHPFAMYGWTHSFNTEYPDD